MMQMHRPQQQQQQQLQQLQPQEQKLEQIALASGVSMKSSTNFLKRLCALSISTISYLRNVFPEEAYGDKRLGSVSLKVIQQVLLLFISMSSQADRVKRKTYKSKHFFSSFLGAEEELRLHWSRGARPAAAPGLCSRPAAVPSKAGGITANSCFLHSKPTLSFSQTFHNTASLLLFLLFF